MRAEVGNHYLCMKMILNFYLRKYPPKGEMRSVERQNLAKVRVLLKKRGVQNASRFDYHEANQLLAKLIADNIR